MASSVRKKALKIGPSSPKVCVQRWVPSRTASSRWPHIGTAPRRNNACIRAANEGSRSRDRSRPRDRCGRRRRCLRSSPRAAQPSSSRPIASALAPSFAARSAAEAGASCSASKTPIDTAANIVFERRNASMRSSTGCGSGRIHKACEVVVAERRERRAVESALRPRSPFAHRTNSGQRQAFEFVRHADARRRGEQQFVVLAAVQRLFESRAAIERRRRDFALQPRRRAEAVQVERQPVAQVHGGGGTQAGAQKPAEREPRLGPLMPLQPCRGP